MPRLIAAKSARILLFDVGDGMVQVLRDDQLFPPWPLQSVLARGYWLDLGMVEGVPDEATADEMYEEAVVALPDEPEVEFEPQPDIPDR